MPLFVKISVLLFFLIPLKRCAKLSHHSLFLDNQRRQLLFKFTKPKEETLGKGQEIEIHNFSNGLDRASIY